MLDVGDNLPEKDEEYHFDERDEAESAEEEADDDFDPEEVVKKLQPIIRKRIQFIELIREQKKQSVIHAKDGTVTYESEWNKESKKHHKERSKTTYGDCSALPAIDGPSRKSKDVDVKPLKKTTAVTPLKKSSAVTPLKKSIVSIVTPGKSSITPSGKSSFVTPSGKLSNKTNFEEIEEIVTTTTVTTTTKKIRRVVSLDRNDENTLRTKRKLSMAPIDEDEFRPMDAVPKSESKKSRTDNAPAIQSASIVLYDAKRDDKLMLDADGLNQAILDKTHNNESFVDLAADVLPVQPNEQPVQVQSNEILFYQTGQSNTTDLTRVIKTKSKVDPLRRMSLVTLPRLCIESKAGGKSKWNWVDCSDCFANKWQKRSGSNVNVIHKDIIY